ncbi:MAG: VWA domain-containing protein, partial [Paenibacillus sp.]|uniref:vWA domain-containing protein n=1 Tax=Paenibacillus sp. TaxID=58172 RepID=UPI00290CF807
DGAAGAERGPQDGGQAADSPPYPPAEPGRAPEGGEPRPEAASEAAATPQPAPPGDGQAHGRGASATGEEREPGEAAAAARAVVEAVGRGFEVQRLAFAPPRSRSHQAKAGKRNPASESSRGGRYIRAEAPRGAVVDLALDATLRTAAPYQKARRQLAADRGEGEGGPRPTVLVEYSDLRVKVRESRTGTALLFVVDASGSMNAAKRMKAVKGAVLSLLRDAYRQRDSVGLVAFRDRGAELLLDITRSVELAERRLKAMPVGGRTPLVAGLEKGEVTLRTLLHKGSGLVPAMILLTDGKVNVGTASRLDPWPEIQAAGSRLATEGIQTMVIDTEQGFVRLGYARKLAEALGAQYIRLEELEAGRIAQAVRSLTAGTQAGQRRSYTKR